MRQSPRRAAAALAGLAAATLMAGGGTAMAARTAANGSAAAGWEAAGPVGGPLLGGSGIIVHYPGKRAPRLPRVPASAYVIANATTGQVLAAKDPHGQFGPASTLKVLTAVTLIPRLNPGMTVIASRLATSVEPNIVGLIRGRAYQVADLFRALLLISANDAAVALTQATGSFDKGMALINAEAHHLQAYDTVAVQPNGLPAPGQHVSAYDLALIARQALSMPAFMRYDSTLAARFPVKPRKLVTLVNQNYLLTQYRGGIGGKIGWTMKSGATYIGMARRNGVTLIVTVLHCAPLTEIISAEKLLNWGFAMHGKVSPVGVLVPPLAAATAAARAEHAPARNGATVRSRQPGWLTDSQPRGSGSAVGLKIGIGLAAGLSVGVAAISVVARRRRRGQNAARHSTG